MRTGLVAIGVALTVVGAGVSLTAFLQTPQSTNTQLAPFSVTDLPSGAATTDVLWMQNTSSGSVQIEWVSAGPLNVTFYKAGSCSMMGRICPHGSAIATWSSATVGRWTVSGALSFPYVLNFFNAGAQPTNITGSAVETYAAGSTTPPTWALVASLAGGVSCISIGAVALYLGLFLRDGVYSSASAGRFLADDLDDYAAGDDPEEPADDLGDGPSH